MIRIRRTLLRATATVASTVLATMAVGATSSIAVPPTPVAAAPPARVIPLQEGQYSWGTDFGVSGSMWSSGHHTGQDFPASTGTKILAAANGTIKEAGDGGAYGNMTIERVDEHTELLYAHQSRFLTRAGAEVKAGQVIGLVGATGNTTGPHLHFEVRIDGQQVDPKAWLNGATNSAGTTTMDMGAMTAAPQSVQEAQIRSQIAAEEYAAANLKATESRRIIDAATMEEMESAQTASDARSALAQLTRNAYMNAGGGEAMESLQAALDGPEAVSGMSRTQVAVDNEITARSNVMLAAQKTAETKHTISVAALQTYQQAANDLETKTAAYESATASYRTELAAYNAGVSAGIAAPIGMQTTIGPDGCPTTAPAGMLRDGSETIGVTEMCRRAVADARTPAAAVAIKFAFSKLGAPYSQAARTDPNTFDCTALVARAYFQGAGITKFFSDYPWTGSYADGGSWTGLLAKVADHRAGDIRIMWRPGISIEGSVSDNGHGQMYLTDGYVIQSGGSGENSVNISRDDDWGWNIQNFAYTGK